MEHPVDWLQSEYLKRRGKNAGYSLRAFARQLGIASGPLSEILAKKRRLTPRQARDLADRLTWSYDERARFLSLCDADDGDPVAGPDYKRLAADTFCLIADWYHYAILSLSETAGFRSDVRWIAGRLGLSPVEARIAVDRLLRLGLLKKIKHRLVTGGEVTTSQDVPSAALKRFHRQGLERAAEALEGVALELRDITSITMAIDIAKLPLAKERIANFRRQLSKLLEDGKRGEVYQLSIQLVPLSQRGKLK